MEMQVLATARCHSLRWLCANTNDKAVASAGGCGKPSRGLAGDRECSCFKPSPAAVQSAGHSYYRTWRSHPRNIPQVRTNAHAGPARSCMTHESQRAEKPKCPSTTEWMNRRSAHTVERYSAIKRKYHHAPTGMNPETGCRVKEARHGSPCVGWPHPHGVSRGGGAPGRRDECLPRAGAAETGALLESGGPFGVLTRSQIHHGGDGTSLNAQKPLRCALQARGVGGMNPMSLQTLSMKTNCPR